MDQKGHSSPGLTQEVKWELDVPAAGPESRKTGELPQEFEHAGTQHRALKSCLFGENKKRKAALKAEGNPADEEQPLSGLSQQIHSSNTRH